MVFVVALRLLAKKYKWSLPKIKELNGNGKTLQFRNKQSQGEVSDDKTKLV
jgi:hypothetical protein